MTENNVVIEILAQIHATDSKHKATGGIVWCGFTQSFQPQQADLFKPDGALRRPSP
jgi:hypothetical protein